MYIDTCTHQCRCWRTKSSFILILQHFQKSGGHSKNTGSPRKTGLECSALEHLHFYIFSHFHVFTFLRFHIFTLSHFPIFTFSYFYIFTFSHFPIFTFFAFLQFITFTFILKLPYLFCAVSTGNSVTLPSRETDSVLGYR